jgi:ATP-dependent RNA helicase DeaD
MNAENPIADAPTTFDLLPLTTEVRAAIDEMGWVTPTPVQLAAFGPASEGSDIVVQARTGTGKTAAFGLPLIDKRVRTEPQTQVLILAPTRELALQSAKELERIGRHRGIRTSAVYGGAPMERQVRELAEGAQIVSGTPGRVLDHLRRGSLNPEHIRTLVLDEADEMLSMGFAKELHAIVDELPKSRQTMLFSATLDEAIQRLAAKFLRDPVQLSLSSDQVGAQTITHFVYLVSGLGKPRDLIRILEVDDPESAIIFCNTKAATEQLAAELQVAGLNADWLNGDLPQGEREKVLGATRKGTLRYLVATDVAARGIDISHLTHVINYDFPDALEQYVHRTGRTGRAGRTGTAISLVTPGDLGQLYYLRLQFKIFPTERVLPSAGELKARSEMDRIEMIRAAFADHQHGATHDSLRAIARRVLAHDDAEAIVAGLVGSFLGAHGSESEVEDQAAAARRARPARPATDEAAEAPREPRRDRREPRRREDGRDDRREARREEPRRDEPRRDEPRRDEPRREEARREEARREEARREEARREERVEEPRRDDEEPRRRRRRERDERSVEARTETLREVAAAQPVLVGIEEMRHVEVPPMVEASRAPDSSVGRSAGDAREDEDDDVYANVFLNIGRRDGTRVGDILRLFEQQTGLGKDALGRIRIRDRHSFVAVPTDRVEEALGKLAGVRYGDKELVAEIARAERSQPETPEV